MLPDWIDPDGDDIYLKSVVATGGDEVDFTSDGRITYRAIGGDQGRKEVDIVVSDGSKDAAGTLSLEIRPVGTTAPVTNADHVVTRVDESITIFPLTNDTSAGKEQLRLTHVEQIDDVTIDADYGNRSFSFRAPEAGVYYVPYTVSSGPHTVPGLVRVDVLDSSADDSPPVAVRDIALLPRGGEVLVNVLANDTDPAGGVLVVQSVSVEAQTGIGAAVLGHETVRISDLGGSPQQTRVTYTISNGIQSVQGEIVVIPVPAPEQLKPPVAVDDRAVVRVGDVVDVSVLDNDYHPNNDTLSLSPDLIPPLVDPERGEAFVSEDVLRFRAGDQPGTVNVTYEVVDSTGQRDAGYVTIQIIGRDDDANSAPRPRDLEARVLAGARVQIPVPLDGIDEDGDSVELVGIVSAPSKGRITEVGEGFLIYEAFGESAGLDSFTYRVVDQLGKEATATVRVGIAPTESTNQAPYAVRDAVVIRPGRQVAVPVLANDSDPDGDLFGFAEDPILLPDVPRLNAEVSGSHIIVTAPDEEMETSFQYSITDARGLSATTTVHVTVDNDVPLERPIARDDRVRAEDVDENGVASVAILDNDEDPDGVRSDLAVELGAGSDNATVDTNGTLTVTLTDERQLISYTITDPDGLTASAFVRVPSLTSLPPALISTEGVEVQSGEPIELPLADYVRASGGRDVIITEAAKVSAVHSDGNLIVDQRTLTYTSRPGYHGADALTFEVTDGSGPDDPDGRKSTLTIPVTVLPPDNQPPSMVGATLDVAAGEDASTLNLRELSSDPDEGDLEILTYTIGDLPEGLSATIDGAVLRVSAAADVRKGTAAPLAVTVTDGQSDPVDATINIRVIASTRELPTVNDDVYDQVNQGETVSVDVLTNDINPFSEVPLRIVSALPETGQANVDIVGDRVEVTPASDFVGTLVVRYTVQDRTEDPDRQVDGRIRMTVQGIPDAPGRPTVTTVSSRTVVLSWSPPSDNGASISGYTVRSTSGGYERQCPSTTCTLDGLTNNVEYNFTVTATNRVGESEPSAASETARPDIRPETPAAPSLEFGDQSLTVTWTTPRTEGSPVDSYTLEISPAPPSGVVQRVDVTGNEVRWDGLRNGVAYEVRVRAHNRAPDPSDWSAWSASEVPAAPPSAPAAPTTERLDPVPPQAQIRANWVAPTGNGDAIGEYELRVLQGSNPVRTVTGIAPGQLSQAVTLDTSTSNYSFSVRARNKAGWGEWSPASAEIRAFTPPAAPTSVSASAGNNQVTVNWTAGALNGANANEVRYEYSVDGGNWRSDWASGGNNGTGVIANGQVNNNGQYTVRVRAVVSVDGTTYSGGASGASNRVAPFGPIANPSASATANGLTITFRWDSPARNGQDITTQINTGSGWRTVDARGSGSVTVGASESRSIQVRTRTSSYETTASASAKAADARVWVTQGDAAGNCVNGCRQFMINTQYFDGGRYTVTCHSDAYGGFSTMTLDIPSNGRVQHDCYHGRDGINVWVDIHGWGGSVDTEKTHWPRP